MVQKVSSFPPFAPPEPTFEPGLDESDSGAWRCATMLPPPGAITEEMLEQAVLSRSLADDSPSAGERVVEAHLGENARPTDKTPPWWATSQL